MKPPETNPGRDLGAERDMRAEKPCCNRLPDGSWCLGPAGHSDTAFCENKTPPVIDHETSTKRSREAYEHVEAKRAK